MRAKIGFLMAMAALVLGCSNTPHASSTSTGSTSTASSSSGAASTATSTTIGSSTGTGASSGGAGATTSGGVADAGPDAGTDAGPTCAPLLADVDDAGPATALGTNGCVQTLACDAGQVCYAPTLTCTAADQVEGSAGDGRGGYASDGGACEATLGLPLSCDAVALDFGASQDLSLSASSLVESDTVLAADGQGTVVAAWSAIPPGTQVNRIAVSHDDGATFLASAAPTNASTDAANDSALAYDPRGLWLYTWEGYADNFQGAQHIWLAESLTGDSWSAPVQVDTPGDFQAGGALDFDWVAFNPVTSQPYVTYEVSPADGPATVRLAVGSAGDGGVLPSFAPSLELDDGTRPDFYRDLVRTGFDSAGSFYAAWFELGDANGETGGTLLGSALNAIYFARLDLASDGGLVPLPANVRVSGAGQVLPFDGPGIAVAPSGGAVYVSYLVGTQNATDVYVAHSHDRGATWSPSVKVNDDPTCATHFHSTLALDAAGRLYVFWYDNRDGNGHFFYAVSDDGAQTFHPNRLVSAPIFPFDTFQYSTGWLGDYYEPAITASTLYLLWADGRAGDQSHAYFAKAPLPQ